MIWQSMTSALKIHISLKTEQGPIAYDVKSKKINRHNVATRGKNRHINKVDFFFSTARVFEISMSTKSRIVRLSHGYVVRSV